MLKLYENIKEYRLKKGLTQDALARLTGYSDRSSIAKIERGGVDLSRSKIEQFAEVFGVAPGDLMGWDAEPEDQGALAAAVLNNSELNQLVKNYMQLSAADRATVSALVASLANKKD